MSSKLFILPLLILIFSILHSDGNTQSEIQKSQKAPQNEILIPSDDKPNEYTVTYKKFGKKHLAVQIAIYEWVYFGGQTIFFDNILVQGHKETEDKYWQQIGVYWSEGTGFSKTGKDTDWPWSAAFISWVMKEAQMGDDFPYSIRHSEYIVHSIKNRKENVEDAAIVGYQLDEYAPEVGDLVCYSREKNISYNSVGNFKSHCDLVVYKQRDRIEVIGGNVDDSVSLKVLYLDADGNLNDVSKPWFVVIKVNR